MSFDSASQANDGVAATMRPARRMAEGGRIAALGRKFYETPGTADFAEAALCRACPVVHSRTDRPMCRRGPVSCRGGLCTAAAAPFHQSTFVNTLTIACASSTVRSSLPPFTTTNTRLSGAGLLGVLTTIVPVQSAATV